MEKQRLRIPMVFRPRGCYDCLNYGCCGNPNADKDSDYCCDSWDWKYE